MGRSIEDAVRDACLWLPETQEKTAHGMQDFRVRKKTFATLAINHHGDGRIALWLHSPQGAQELYVDGDPEHFFVPPYVGPRGWLGVHLDRGLDWGRIASLVREAYANVAPSGLAEALGATPEVAAPNESVDPEIFDPLSAAHLRETVAAVRSFCLALPEVSEATQFGSPCWKAGKKTFCGLHRHQGRLALQCWVGADRQGTLTFDPRYRVPAYSGHNGWISLDAEDGVMHKEVEALILDSYRHFALKRMLKTLDGG
jgi:predicted DNA-binding protein (MmcQ/YjbR family)